MNWDGRKRVIVITVKEGRREGGGREGGRGRIFPNCMRAFDAGYLHNAMDIGRDVKPNQMKSTSLN